MPAAGLAGVTLARAVGSPVRGAAVLNEFGPAFPKLFNVGEEMLVYRDFNELFRGGDAVVSPDW